LKPEWREKINAAEINKRIYDNILKDIPLLEGDDPGR
jgi:hypothetical protein